MDDVLRLVAVFALIGANAYFVIGEYAVVTARRSAIQARGGRGSASALRLMDDPVRVISTVQVGITALGILTGAIGEPAVRHALPEDVPRWASFVVAFASITYFSVVLGELVPKALTLDRAETLAVLVARPIELLSILLGPVVTVLQGTAQFVLRPFGVKEVIAGDSIRSPEELRALVDEAEEGGVIPRAQEELLHNIFDFATREARDVMLPSAEVDWLDASEPIPDARRRAAEFAHTRYPVGQGSLDQVVGVAHLRELVAGSESETVADIAQDVLIVPGTKDLGALLRDMREQRQQLAVVADEYGRTLGIVTLEDILEEIVGEIEDEYDLPDSTLNRLEDGSFRAAGSMTIDDFNEAVGTAFEADDVRTLAGLVFDRLGRRPEPGERVMIDGAEFVVEEIDGARIAKLRVRPA